MSTRERLTISLARAVTRGVLLASLLTAASSCDKIQSGQANAGDSAARADTTTGFLFLVFGGRSDPRMIAVAKVRQGEFEDIADSEDEWRLFDSRYFRGGRSYPLYSQGRDVGKVVIRRGMWEQPDSVLYALPNCQEHMPLAAVSVPASVAFGAAVEALASTKTLVPVRGGALPDSATLAAEGRTLGQYVGSHEGIARATLDSLDFSAQALNTGVSATPTIVVGYVDPNAAQVADRRRTAHLFVVGEKGPKGYAASYTHAENGRAENAEYRRLVDHIDITGDGIDELILEGWHFGRSTFPIILAYRNGKWEEAYRGRASWCLD